LKALTLSENNVKKKIILFNKIIPCSLMFQQHKVLYESIKQSNQRFLLIILTTRGLLEKTKND
jgi:hypothetical protein